MPNAKPTPLPQGLLEPLYRDQLPPYLKDVLA